MNDDDRAHEFAIAIELDDYDKVQSIIDNETIDLSERLFVRGLPTPLLYAMQLGRDLIVEMLLKADPRVVHGSDERGITACHLAAERGNVELLAKLLAQGRAGAHRS
jgi:ankyrin repeat protein